MIHPAGKPRDEPSAPPPEADYRAELRRMVLQLIWLGRAALVVFTLAMVVFAWEHRWSNLVALVLPWGLVAGSVDWLGRCWKGVRD